jgi:glycerate kinase
VKRSALHVLVAPDSFKGSLSAADAAKAMRTGILSVVPQATVSLHPVSDGGEGFLGTLALPLGAAIVTTNVQGPLPGCRVAARWGIADHGQLAIIEMAEAAGLLLVPPGSRNPGITTSYGVGEVMRAALDRGARKLLIGIGGSATNDGGAGMAAALGVVFQDEAGEILPPGGKELLRLARIDMTGFDVRLAETKVTAACDVANPLTGPRGASVVYGPQKGADAAMVANLDSALSHYAEILRRRLGRDVGSMVGSGGGGGIGAGLAAFCHAHLEQGIDTVLDATGFDAALADVDLVLTGEGKLDAQTSAGKAVAGVVRRAHAAGVPVAAVVGSVEGGTTASVMGFAAIETLCDKSIGVDNAMRQAASLLAERTAQLLTRMRRGV